MVMTEMSLAIWKQPASLHLHILNCQCDKIISSLSHCHDKYRILLNYLGKWGCEKKKAQVIQNMNNIRWLNYLKTVSCHLLLALFIILLQPTQLNAYMYGGAAGRSDQQQLSDKMTAGHKSYYL
jgi:hypothetical protein